MSYHYNNYSLQQSPPPFSMGMKKQIPMETKKQVPVEVPTVIAKKIGSAQKAQSLGISKRVSLLEAMWPAEAKNSENLNALLKHIEDNKSLWQTQLEKTNDKILKIKTPIEKSGTKKDAYDNVISTFFSVYVVKGKQPNSIRTYVNLGEEQKLGKGAYKEVFKVIDTDTLKQKALIKAPCDTPEEKVICDFEATIMGLFPNKKTLLQSNSTAEIETHSIEGTKKKQYMITHLCELGDLRHYEEKHGKLSEQDRNQIALDVLKAVSILHKLNLAHQDIKPHNILIYRNKQGKIHAKIGDHGFAEFIYNESKVCKEVAVAGTPIWLSPEKFLASNQVIESGHLKGSDAFALGLTLYTMFFGEAGASLKNPKKRVHPFHMLYKKHFKHDPALLKEEIIREYAAKFNKPHTPIQQAVFGLFNPDPTKRLSVTEAYSLLKSALT